MEQSEIDTILNSIAAYGDGFIVALDKLATSDAPEQIRFAAKAFVETHRSSLGSNGNVSKQLRTIAFHAYRQYGPPVGMEHVSESANVTPRSNGELIRRTAGRVTIRREDGTNRDYRIDNGEPVGVKLTRTGYRLRVSRLRISAAGLDVVRGFPIGDNAVSKTFATHGEK